MSTIDYDKLLDAIKACLDSESLRRQFIKPSAIAFTENSPIIKGGFGDVQKAAFTGARNSAIAVKKLRTLGDWKQRVRIIAALCRELRVWAKLTHPNILGLTGFYYNIDSLDTAWVITVWQEYGNVLDYIAQVRPNEDGRLKLALGTAQGLEYLHTRKPPICHADIKPENTLVDQQGNAMLCDFGLARAIEDESTGLTTTHSVKFTTRYASPELMLVNDARHTLKSDIWAWGCLLLDMMTGIRPFASYRDQNVIVPIISRTSPADLTEISAPRFIVKIMERCWQQDTDSRPDATWCSDALQRKSAQLFQSYCSRKVSDVPANCKAEKDGWHEVFDQEANVTFNIEFLTGFDDIELDGVVDIQFSPDRSGVAVCDNTAVRFYDVADGEQQSIFDLSTLLKSYTMRDNITAITFDEHWSHIAIGHLDGLVRVWDFSRWTLLSELPGHTSHVRTLAWSTANSILVSASTDDTLRVWDVQSGTTLQVLRLGYVCNIVGSPHHDLLAIMSWKQMTIYNAGTGRVASQLDLDCVPSTFTPDGESLFCYRFKPQGLRLYDMRSILGPRGNNGRQGAPASGAVVSTFMQGTQPSVNTLAVSSDGQLAASGSTWGGDLVLWDVALGLPVLKLGGLYLSQVCHLTFRPGSTAAAGILAFTSKADLASGRTLRLVKYGLRA